MSKDVLERLERLRAETHRTLEVMAAAGLPGKGTPLYDYEDALDEEQNALYDVAPALIAVARAMGPLLEHPFGRDFSDDNYRCKHCGRQEPRHYESCPVPTAQTALEALRDG